VVHAHPFPVLTTIMSLSFLAISLPLQLLQHILPSSPSSQKLAVLLEHYFLTWVFLVGATVQIQKYQMGGIYWITAWHLCAWIASSAALAEGTFRGLKQGEERRKAGLDLTVDSDYDNNPQGPRLVSGVLYEAPEGRNSNDGNEEQVIEEGEVVETEPTEITPLMNQHRENGTTQTSDSKYEEYGWWILQMAVSVPLPALLLFQIALLLMHALMNTLVDGSSPMTVYAGISALSLLIFIPITPFAHKLHHWLTLAVVIVFALSLSYSWTTYPFTQDKPFKIYFQQQLEVDAPSRIHGHAFTVNSMATDNSTANDQMAPSLVRAVTTLTGLRGYVDSRVVPELPSSWGKDVQCYDDNILKPGLLVCEWESDLLPSPGGNRSGETSVDWLDVKTTRRNSTSGTIYVKGTNTRGCRLYFDKPIAYYAIHDVEEGDVPAAGQFLPGYEMPREGVKELRLWSRSWDKAFVVEFGWEAKEDDPDFEVMGGRAACEWAEYASASAGGNSPVSQSGLIPALEEVKAFLPLWSLPTKATDGLIEAWTKFTI